MVVALTRLYGVVGRPFFLSLNAGHDIGLPKGKNCALIKSVSVNWRAA
jgi:hypothetical protein